MPKHVIKPPKAFLLSLVKNNSVYTQNHKNELKGEKISINLGPKLKLTMFINTSNHPMHYSRSPAGTDSKREHLSQHICKNSTGKKSQLVFASNENTKVNKPNRQATTDSSPSSQRAPSKKTASVYTFPKDAQTPFHVDRKDSLSQGKSLF